MAECGGRCGAPLAAGLIMGVMALGIPDLAWAEQSARGEALGGALGWIVVAAAASLVPLLFVSVTAFAKISVVLGILRHAIGTPQVPSATVVTGMSLVLTFFVMAPVMDEMWTRAEPVLNGGAADETEVERVRHLAEALREPLVDFLRHNASEGNLALFERLARRPGRPDDEQPTRDDLIVLAPAFMVSELSEAFIVGFLLFVPFVVIDLVVSNILMALGMPMLSPLAISLPLKLLLFVMVDGWRLVCYGLVTSYH